MSPNGQTMYFEAATAILAAEGADGVTIAALCERVHVTTGAFYYHFGSMAGFVAAFTANWAAEWEGVIERARAEPDPMRLLELLAGAVLATPIRSEAAFRSWARTNEVVRAVVRTADRAAVAVARDALAEVLGDGERAALLAYMANSLVVGLLMQDEPADPERFVAVVLEWFRSNAGIEATVTVEDGAAVVRLS